jgi:hypothetical protein
MRRREAVPLVRRKKVSCDAEISVALAARTLIIPWAAITPINGDQEKERHHHGENQGTEYSYLHCFSCCI